MHRRKFLTILFTTLFMSGVAHADELRKFFVHCTGVDNVRASVRVRNAAGVLRSVNYTTCAEDRKIYFADGDKARLMVAFDFLGRQYTCGSTMTVPNNFSTWVVSCQTGTDPQAGAILGLEQE